MKTTKSTKIKGETKMKTIRSIFALTLTFCMFIGVTACKLGGGPGGGGNTVDNTVEDEKNLEIMVINKGYGTAWLTKIAEEFEKDYASEGINVDISVVADSSATATSIEGGPKLNDVDLYFDLSGSPAAGRYLAYTNKWGYEQALMDYSDIYSSTVPGESVTVGEKMIDSVFDELTIKTKNGPKQYTMTWASGVMGMFYNKDTLSRVYPGGYTLPKTTNDLIAMMDDVKNAGYTAICYPSKLNQLQNALAYPLWAQYEGLSGVDNFFNGLWYNEDIGDWEVSANVLKQQGILEALKVCEKIANPENGYTIENILAYDGTNFRNLQLKFFSSYENIAFYPCGDWLEQESSFDGASEVGMMKTPVISSIVDTLSTVKTEAALKEVISYVDGETATVCSAYSTADIERIREARNIYFSNGFSHYAYSPVYCNAQKLVKKFLTYMATDKAIRIYKENVAGGFLPFEYDYSGMTLKGAEKDVAKIISGANLIDNFYDSKLSLIGGLQPFCGSSAALMDYVFACDRSNKFRMSAEEFYRGGFLSDSEWAYKLSLCQ